MAEPDPRAGLFPALLKHWRGKRGLSQLDLALAADVSARHVSFLETGRSRPSEAMVVRLGSALSVPLRHVNAMLEAAGHPAAYEDSPGDLPGPVKESLSLLKRHHEPFPLMVVDRTYHLHDVNRGGLALFGAVLGLPVPRDAPPAMIAGLGLNLARLTFDPNGAQPFVQNFEVVGRELLWRVQREVLADPDDPDLRRLLEELLAMPTLSPAWREVDLSVRSEPALVLHLRKDDLDLRFLLMITAFHAPQNVAVEELRVEHWFPRDAATAEACRRLAGE